MFLNDTSRYIYIYYFVYAVVSGKYRSKLELKCFTCCRPFKALDYDLEHSKAYFHLLLWKIYYFHI